MNLSSDINAGACKLSTESALVWEQALEKAASFRQRDPAEVLREAQFSWAMESDSEVDHGAQRLLGLSDC
jgi:hypothetical protein